MLSFQLVAGVLGVRFADRLSEHETRSRLRLRGLSFQNQSQVTVLLLSFAQSACR
jgi:hypothetical protein